MKLKWAVNKMCKGCFTQFIHDYMQLNLYSFLSDSCTLKTTKHTNNNTIVIPEENIRIKQTRIAKSVSVTQELLLSSVCYLSCLCEKSSG